MAKTLELKRFSVKMPDGKKYGPKEPLGPIIENVPDELADKLIAGSNGDIIEQPKAKAAKGETPIEYTKEQEAAIRAEGKELGIKNSHSMKIPNLLKLIEEAKAAKGQDEGDGDNPQLPPLE